MSEVSKYDKEMHDYLESIRQLCTKDFVDFIVIGVDIAGDESSILQVGDIKQNTTSNRNRIIRMNGELEDAKFDLKLGNLSKKDSSLDNITKLCYKEFEDFIIIGIDVLGNTSSVLQVGDLKENNKNRINRMMGELGDAIFDLQMGSYQDMYGGDNEEDDFDDDVDEPDEPWNK